MSETHDPKAQALRAYGDLRLLLLEWVYADTEEQQTVVFKTIDLWLRTHCYQCGAPTSHIHHDKHTYNDICWLCRAFNNDLL